MSDSGSESMERQLSFIRKRLDQYVHYLQNDDAKLPPPPHSREARRTSRHSSTSNGRSVDRVVLQVGC